MGSAASLCCAGRPAVHQTFKNGFENLEDVLAREPELSGRIQQPHPLRGSALRRLLGTAASAKRPRVSLVLQGSRYDDNIAEFGRSLQKKMESLNIFLVGWCGRARRATVLAAANAGLLTVNCQKRPIERDGYMQGVLATKDCCLHGLRSRPPFLPLAPGCPNCQVGAGALGCEFLKNFALMGVACGECAFTYNQATWFVLPAEAAGVPQCSGPLCAA